MALIDINNLKLKAGDVANKVGKGVSTAATNVAGKVSGATKNVGNSVNEFATNMIIKLLKGVDVDSILNATETYGEKSGKDVSATVKFLNNLKSLKDGK